MRFFDRHKCIAATVLLLCLAAVIIPALYILYKHPATPPHVTAGNQPGTGALAPAVAAIQSPADDAEDALVILVKQAGAAQPSLIPVEKDLLTEFAREQNLKPVWKTFNNTEELFSYMDRIRGDLIIADYEDSRIELGEPVEYSFPWGFSSQQVVVRSDSDRLKDIRDLVTRQVAAKKSSPAWPELKSMLEGNPGMDLLALPEHMDTETVLSGVSTGLYDVAVLDNFTLEQTMPRFLDLEIAFNLGGEKALSWAVRSTSGDLHLSLNRFLYRNHLKLNVSQFYREDLPDLKRRKLLRLITYQDPINYSLHNGKLQGFEYEMLERFAKSNRMRLEVEIADSHQEMIDMLISGRGDIVAASLPRESVTDTTQGIVHTRHYAYSTPVVIGRSLDYPLLDARDLEGRRVVLPATSPFHSTLQHIRDSGIDFEIVVAPPELNTAAILFQVSRGEVDLTVIGSQQINSEFAGHLNLKSHFTISEPLPLSWVVRAGDTQLAAALNGYIEKEFRKAIYNVLQAKYYENPVPGRNSELLSKVNRLSPYDDIVLKYADEYDFDWRLIVAQMYQESRFNPAAVSYAGAEGLMQLIPETAKLVGIKDLYDPDSSIHGGIKYLAWLRERFEDDLPMEDRTWFTLAAYNAGYNRVKRARWLADKMALDRNKWFDNVEKAMLALAKPYRKNGVMTRYCRCGQTAHYIREIKTLYDNYVRLSQSVRLASTPAAFDGEG